MRFINQSRIMSEINPIIDAIKSGHNQNILLQGPAGCGKTSLSKFIADGAEFDYSFQIPVKGKINYLALSDYRVNLIDEVHKFKEWELLYPYLDKNEHSFIFCTTEYGESPEPFLSRCIRFTFDPYSVEDLSEIIYRYSLGRRFKLSKESCLLIANISRGNPRIAKQRFDRVKMMLNYYGHEKNPYFVKHVLRSMGVYSHGYTTEDLRYLKYLYSIGHSSITNLSRALQIDKNTLVKEIEPFLLEKGNIMITSKGRKFIKWPYTKKTHQ